MDGYLLGRIRGVEVRLNWSVLVIGLLIAWSVADSVLPEYAEGHGDATYWAVGVTLAVAFLAGLLAHELGHSLVAQREGVDVSGITLWMFGGVAVLARDPATPRAALRIAVAGPLVSIALGVVSLAVAAPLGGLTGVALAWFGGINLLLAGFNLLPAYPLDGGRIYRAWQWQRSGDELEATERATTVGLVVGAALVATGVVQIAFGSLIGGVWMMMIGWFLRDAARAEFRQAVVDRPLAQIAVREVMTPDPVQTLASTRIEDFIQDLFFGGRHAAYPVVGSDGTVTGLVTINDVRRLGPDQRTASTVGDVARPLDRVAVVSPDEPVTELLARIGPDRDARALVVDAGSLVGIVSPSDISRLVTVVEMMGGPPGSPSGVPVG